MRRRERLREVPLFCPQSVGVNPNELDDGAEANQIDRLSEFAIGAFHHAQGSILNVIWVESERPSSEPKSTT